MGANCEMKETNNNEGNGADDDAANDANDVDKIRRKREAYTSRRKNIQYFLLACA